MKIPRNDNELASDSFGEEDYEGLIDGKGQYRKPPPPNPILNCCVTGLAMIQFSWVHHRTEFILALILFGAVTLLVTGVIEAYESSQNVNVRKHSFAHDYSDIQSALEIRLGSVDHWCLDGGDKDCGLCEDPTHPSPRYNHRDWGKAYMRNVHRSMDYLKEHPKGDIDVIFLGDSNTEARAGTFHGSKGEGQVAEVLAMSKRKFDKVFDKSKGGRFNGLALGIAGDTSVNLLWRIQQNEFVDLSPKVWWLDVGSNDLFSTMCSEEITIMGILRVVEELISMDESANIVINSLYPVATRKSMSLDGKYVHNKFWYSIAKVNERLKAFAGNHPTVKFFDGNAILTEHKGHNLYMQKDLFMDKMHLSEKGQAEIINAQADTLENILKKLEEKAKKEQQETKDPNEEDGKDGNEGWWSDQSTDDFLDYYDMEGVDDLLPFP